MRKLVEMTVIDKEKVTLERSKKKVCIKKSTYKSSNKLICLGVETPRAGGMTADST